MGPGLSELPVGGYSTRTRPSRVATGGIFVANTTNRANLRYIGRLTRSNTGVSVCTNIRGNRARRRSLIGSFGMEPDIVRTASPGRLARYFHSIRSLFVIPSDARGGIRRTQGCVGTTGRTKMGFILLLSIVNTSQGSCD